MSSDVGRYRRYAARCVEMAKEHDRPADKVRLLNMAEHWRRLADHAETIANRLVGIEDQLPVPPDPSSSPD
jgi:hypothetical protein